jgi:hypothetical protein
MERTRYLKEDHYHDTGRHDMVAATETTPNKSDFVVAVLKQNPRANPKVIREAWAKAGNEGTISTTLVSKFRRQLGLTGNIKGRRGPGRPRGSSRKAANGHTAPEGNGTVVTASATRTSRGGLLAEVESDIDRVIFKLMGVRGFEDIEDKLRSVRRLLVIRGHNG